MILNGTTYHHSTPPELAEILEGIRLDGTRVAISYGNPKTGEEWGDVERGTLSRSTGRVQVPIVIHNRRSTGGPGLLDHCIVEIRHSNKRNGGRIYAVEGLK